MIHTAQATRTVAVLGTGSIGTRHLNVLRQIAEVEPIAVPRRPERVRELAAGGHAAVSTLQEAVARGASLAIIATDTGRHVEDGVAALAAGLDLLVEKPLARDAIEAASLVAEAGQRGKQIFVGCVLRFSESLGVFREWLPMVGRLHSVRVECQSYLPDWRPQRPYQHSYSARRNEGGVLRDLIHEIDYTGWIFGWPAALQARLTNTGTLGIEIEEAAELAWDTAQGCAVSVRVDYLTRPTRRLVLACGRDGTIQWDGVEGRVTLARVGEPIRTAHASQQRDAMFLAQALAVLHAKPGAIDERLATGEDGVRALAVCDAARRASAHRREEQVAC